MYRQTLTTALQRISPCLYRRIWIHCRQASLARVLSLERLSASDRFYHRANRVSEEISKTVCNKTTSQCVPYTPDRSHAISQLLRIPHLALIKMSPTKGGGEGRGCGDSAGQTHRQSQQLSAAAGDGARQTVYISCAAIKELLIAFHCALIRPRTRSNGP